MKKDTGAMVKELRKAAGLSQMQLAAKVGVSYQQIQKYEKGISGLSIRRLTRICEVFGVHPAIFFDEGGASDKTTMTAAGSNLNSEELTMLQMFRRLGRKKLRDSFLQMLADILVMAEGKA